MDSLWFDVRYGVRALWRNPRFAAIAILVFAIGIGANTAIFSIINAVLLRPPAVNAPDELVYVDVTSRQPNGWFSEGFSSRDHQRLLRETSGIFSGVLTYRADQARIGEGRDRQLVRGERVSADYFSVLGVRPAMGRSFDPGDNERDATPVVVISDRFWRGELHSDPDVLGRRIELNDVRSSGRGRGYTIVGVVGPAFKGLASTWEPSDYWVPALTRIVDYESWCEPPHIVAFQRRSALVGRLSPESTFGDARRVVLGLRGEIEDPPDWEEWAMVVRESRPSDRLPFAGTFRLVPERLALGLMIVTTVLLLIAAANLTGVLMARGLTRSHELAVRLTLGAGRWCIVRQLFIEGLILASAGGVVGLGLSWALIHAFVGTLPGSPGQFSTSVLLDVPLDASVAAFTIVLCVLAGCLVSIGPARLVSRIGVLGALSGSSVATPRHTRSALRYSIVVPQICLSLVLLLVTGVLVKTLLKVEMLDPGYRPSGLVYVEVGLPGPGFCKREEAIASYADRRMDFERRLLRAAAAVPGATVALASAVPFRNGSSVPVISRDALASGGRNHWIAGRDISPGYLETVGIPLMNGRDFDARDVRGGHGVVMVSQSLARLLWADKNPVGDSLAFYDSASQPTPRWKTVVGVVGDVRETIGVLGNASAVADGTPKPTVYLPIEQGGYGMTVVARGPQSAAQLIQDLVRAVSNIDRGAEVYRSGTVPQAIGELLYPRRVGATILGASGIIGLLLASMGLYGVVSFSVTQRFRELGIRAALGARQRDLVQLIMREGVQVVLLSTVLGVALAVAALRLVAAAVFAVSAPDVLMFLGIPLFLAAVVLLACYVPARRASRIDPAVTLRAL